MPRIKIKDIKKKARKIRKNIDDYFDDQRKELRKIYSPKKITF